MAGLQTSPLVTVEAFLELLPRTPEPALRLQQLLTYLVLRTTSALGLIYQESFLSE